ncbi:hypothetical protein OB13_17475 [Pontibacter sp. HJ8]
MSQNPTHQGSLLLRILRQRICIQNCRLGIKMHAVSRGREYLYSFRGNELVEIMLAQPGW